MKQRLKFSFLISFLFLQLAHSQQVTENKSEQTSPYKQRYGIRIGADISKPIRSIFDKNYFGIELVGDYRINYKYYIAAELGTEQKTNDVDFFSYKTNGQFLRMGVDYNTYGNWYGMENMIFVGGRYGFSVFSQELLHYSIHKDNSYWQESIVGNNPDWLGVYDGQMAHWLELLLGIKVELLRNLYAGASIRMGVLVYQSSEKFPSFWLPAFGKVTDGGRFGASFNYTISYLIPLYKKAKQAEISKKAK